MYEHIGKSLALAILFLLFSYSISAQIEWGLHTTSLTGNYFLVYKKQVDQNRYKRVSAAFYNFDVRNVASLNPNDLDRNTLANISVGTIWGREKRKTIRKNWRWASGIQYIVNGAFQGQNNSLQAALEVGLGYLLSLQVPINSFLYASAEIIPSIELQGTYQRRTINNIPPETIDGLSVRLNGRANLSGVRIGINYVIGGGDQ